MIQKLSTLLEETAFKGNNMYMVTGEKIIYRLFGSALILLSCIGLYFLAFEETLDQKPIKKNKRKEPQSVLYKPWEKDLLELKKQNLLPTEWNNIRKVRLILLDKNLHNELSKLAPPIRTTRNGSYLLEVSFMSHETEQENLKNTGIIVQYNLIDFESKEMIWEHSSTFYVNL